MRGPRPRYAVRRGADFGRAVRLSRELSRRERWARQDVEAFQRERLRALVAHAREGSPLHRRRLGAAAPDVELERLPTMDKATLMAHWDDVVTDPALRLADVEAHLGGLRRDEYLRGRYRALASGGTTGERGVFVFDRREWSTCLAAFLRWSAFVGLRPRLPRIRVATVGAVSPLHMTARFAETVDVGLYRVLRLDARAPVEELAAALGRFRPDVLNGYPSVLALLADEQLDGRLRISPWRVSTTSEVRAPEMEARIVAAWDQVPYDVYGITEVGIFAVDCSHHEGMHLFEDLAIVEVVDGEGRPVPDGEPGHRVLVTNLFNRTLPLIRYELPDLVTLAPEPCRCGRPLRLVSEVAGRTDDVLRLPGGDGRTVAVHPLALRSPLAELSEVRQYRIVHDRAGLDVEMVLADGADPGAVGALVARTLTERLAGLGVQPPPIHARAVSRLERAAGPAAKLKLIESRI
ncbi:MAG: phenylacetate--CoA ligase family protein [Actinobacteria bacterium]|nr:MAG: phenylacetate--CoA ligase family protein [Actinomycetota bacterium]